jgi:uncharacterized membrane protein YadS
VFLGVRFLLGDVLKLGGMSLAFVALELALSILLMTWLGKWMGLSPKLIVVARHWFFYLRSVGDHRGEGSH